MIYYYFVVNKGLISLIYAESIKKFNVLLIFHETLPRFQYKDPKTVIGRISNIIINSTFSVPKEDILN